VSRDSIRRVLRTFLQAFLGVLLPVSLGWLQQVAKAVTDGQTIAVPDRGFWLNVLVSAVIAGFVATVSLIQNLLEDKTGKDTPGLDRSPPRHARL
jgi:hypothetical protein